MFIRIGLNPNELYPYKKGKSLDESERGERKCWLKAQHSEN